MNNGTPWLHELQTAVPTLAVMPHQRVHTILRFKEHGYTNDEAVQAEALAMVNASGKLKLYVSFVQQIMSMGKQPLTAVERICHSADMAQSQLSTINIRRDALIKKLRSAQFECPEVPETKESSRKCPVCGGVDLKAIARQTRGADEGQTIFFICNSPKCGKEFR